MRRCSRLEPVCPCLRETRVARLLVVGKKTDAMKRMLKDLSLSSKVISTGWCAKHELMNYLSCTDIFVLPMRDNAVNHARWPNTIGEYVAMAKPTACSRVIDGAELVEVERIELVAGQ